MTTTNERLIGPLLLGATPTTVFVSQGISTAQRLRVSNPSGAAVRFVFAVGDDNVGNRLFDEMIPAGGAIDAPVFFVLASGDHIQSYAGTASVLVLTVSGTVTSVAGPNLLLRASSDNRYLVDGNGTPFFAQGEAAWSGIVQLNAADLETYLTNCNALGINAIIVSLIEHKFSLQTPPWKNVEGDEPFTGTAFQSSEVAAYFNYVSNFVDACNSHGIVVFLAHTYLGVGGGDEGWYADLTSANSTQRTSWGTYIGNLLKAKPNIVYINYGDFDPSDHTPVDNVRTGIFGADTTHTLETNHYSEGIASHDSASPFTIDSIYKYGGFVYQQMLNGWNDNLAPTVMIEAWYELENGATTFDVLNQSWGAFMSGGTGHFPGHRDIWGFGAGLFQGGTWQNAINNVANVAIARVRLQYLKTFVDSIEWWLGVPDQSATFLTAGAGTFGTANYRLARYCSSWGAVWVPNGSSGGSFTLNRSIFGGPFSWVWFDPSTGATSGGATGVTNSGTQSFTAPDGNPWVWRGKQDP